VAQGRLSCSKESGEGVQQFLKEYRAGEVFGELALLYNAPRGANITAIEDCILWSTNHETFNHLVKNAAIKRRQDYLTLI